MHDWGSVVGRLQRKVGICEVLVLWGNNDMDVSWDSLLV